VESDQGHVAYSKDSMRQVHGVILRKRDSMTICNTTQIDLINHLDISSYLLSVLPLQDRPSVSIELDGGDHNIAGVDANGCGSTV